MMAELTNMLGPSKMSILNLFFLAHNNAQRPKPAPCLAFHAFCLFHYVPNTQKISKSNIPNLPRLNLTKVTLISLNMCQISFGERPRYD